jgi:hypothetical protein
MYKSTVVNAHITVITASASDYVIAITGMYKSTVVYADVTAITASANYGVAELQYESMMDNKVNFYEMP